jgi:hypothetical protein
MIRHDPIPIPIRMAAPIMQASVEVSPIDPEMVPRNACVQVIGATGPSGATKACNPVAGSAIAIRPSAVAPVYPSKATHTASPVI